MLAGTVSLVAVLLLQSTDIHAAGVDKQIALLQQQNSPLLTYPTDFTRNIVPKPIHSHNDYWRDVPLLTALSLGCDSVEADVWLINGTLYVGHERAALVSHRTFESLYVGPLLQILDNQNPKNTFTAGQTTPNGVWDEASDVPLQLLVDMKTDGVSTLPAVLAALQPLRSKGYLTTFANGKLKPSTVTVVGTGSTPLDSIKALEPRDVFFDAPLTQLTDASLNTTWGPELAPIASTDWEGSVSWSGIGNISEAQLSNLTKFVADAHAVGIKARYWDLPGWPLSARDAVWSQLLMAGVDWLNADDLEAASNF